MILAFWIVLVLFCSQFDSSYAVNPLKKLLGGGVASVNQNECDVALVRSLAQALDEKGRLELERDEARKNHDEALSEISRITLEFESIKESLTKRIQELEFDKVDIEESSLLLRTALEKELQETRDEAEKTQKHLIESSEEKISQLRKWWVTKTEDMESHHTMEIRALRTQADTEKEKVKTELTSTIVKLEKSFSEREDETEQKIKELQKDADLRLQEKETLLKIEIEAITKELEITKEKAEIQKSAIRNETMKQFQEKEKDLVKKHQHTLAELERAKKQFEDEKQALLDKATNTLEERESSLHQKHNLLVNELKRVEEEAKSQLEETHRLAAKNLKEREMELTHLLNEKQAELDDYEKKSELDRIEIIQKHEEKIKSIQEDHENAILLLQTQSSEYIAKLKEKIENLDSVGKQQITALKAEAENQVSKMQDKVKEDLRDKDAQHTKDTSKLKETINNLQRTQLKLERKADVLSRKLDLAVKDIQGWQELHKSRSYCNLTHISEDTAAIAFYAGKVATAHVSAVASVTSQQIVLATQSAAKAVATVAEPHFQTGRKLYDNHLKEQIDRHVMPIHNSHVKPVIAIVSKEAAGISQVLYRRVIGEFKAACPAIKKKLRVSKVHPSILRFIRNKCSDPQGTIDQIVFTLFILLLFIFRFSLWRTLCFWVSLPGQVIWYITPLPFIFPSKNKLSSNEVVPSSDDSTASQDDVYSHDVEPTIEDVIKHEESPLTPLSPLTQ